MNRKISKGVFAFFNLFYKIEKIHSFDPPATEYSLSVIRNHPEPLNPES